MKFRKYLIWSYHREDEVKSYEKISNKLTKSKILLHRTMLKYVIRKTVSSKHLL